MHGYSELEGAYVVRARHAHAWTRAHVDGRWMDVDTTPPSWFEAEESLAPAWQGLADFLRWAGFRWSQRGAIEGGVAWYAAAAALLALFAWRFSRARRAARKASPAAPAARSFPGADSEFYAVERALTRRGISPAALDGAARSSFERVLRLHRRYRFDPQGLGSAEREELRSDCLALARALD